MRNVFFKVAFVTLLILTTGAVLHIQKTCAQQPPQPTAQDLIKARKIADTKKLLESHEWIIYVTAPAGKKKVVVETDVLTFKDGRMASKNLSDKGYGESNYTVNFQDEIIYWVTMKTTEELNQVLLRGEFREGAMTGVIEMRPMKGERTTYTFTTAVPSGSPVS